MKSALAHHFLPSVKTRKRARLIRHDAIFYYILLCFMFFAVSRAMVAGKPGILGYASNINISDLLRHVNDQRRERNLPELKLDNDLSVAASAKGKDMFKNSYWSHVSPQGIEPWSFFSIVGYDYSFAGENLAKNFNDSRSVVNAWMNSSSHRENLLSPNFTDVGFAVVNGTLDGYQTTLVVQFFGKRRTPAVLAKKLPEVPRTSEVLITQPSEVLNESKEFIMREAPKVNALPIFDIYFLTKTFALILSGFVFFMFGVDLWYSSAKGVVKLNGHTLAHMFLLLLAIVGIGVVMVPGRVG